MKKILSKIRRQILRLSKHLDLRHNSDWLRYIFIPADMKVLTNYCGMCPDKDYRKFGVTVEKRLANLNKFIVSEEFSNLAKSWGGQVIDKKDYKVMQRFCDKLKNKKLKNKFSNALNKIEAKLKKSDRVILLANISSLAQLEKKSDMPWIIRFVLLHELIHILLIKNKINFQKKNSKYWKYDEGLVTYCDFWLQKKLNVLEKKAKKFKSRMEKWYFVYAIKFRKLLKNKTPLERKKAIFILHKKLK
ncbi:MAG TPA: hypothetical protein HA224_04310 [Nanoarchaeota archaeon]|nr:hypothetical protein [Nanoarchaeota archaeon]